MSAQDGRIERAIQVLSYQLMRVLPTEWTSALGSYGIRKNVHLHRPEIIVGAKRNLRIHYPEAGDEEINRWVDEFLDGVGRLMAEFSVLHRFVREGRLEVSGLEAFKAMAGTRPIVALGLHTGNWETFGPVFQHAGIPLTSFYQPPENAFERRIAEKTRARFGVALLSPDARGVREAMRLLRQNRVVMIFPDEARQGRAMGPLFGRPPHEEGNLAIATRLARHSGAGFVICHSRRIGPCRFHLSFGEMFDLPPTDGKIDHLADVAFLNAMIEPIVRENIPRWYFLDDSIEGIESKFI